MSKVKQLPTEPALELRERLNGRRFGDYVLLQKVGRGGSGVVFRAWQVSLERMVAIKLVDQRDPLDTDRFIREAKIAATLAHAHIIPIYDIGECEGQPYLAMKLISGGSLDETHLEPRRAVELLCQATDAIAFAHKSGIVHRDLKPHNLLVEGGEHVWVTDFGLARAKTGGSTLTATGGVLGTPAYMPPEQARGRRCDERSDVYSLGATLYQLVTGRPPFDGIENLVDLLAQVLNIEPVSPRRLDSRVSVALETIVGKAMAKDPAHRYQSARELGDDLRRYLSGAPITAKPPGWIRKTLLSIGRHPLVTVAFACVVALGVGALFHTLSVKRQLAETTVAEANALGAADQWQAARAGYAQAEAAFHRLGVSSVAPDLGLLDADHHAPPPLLQLAGHTGTVRGVVFLPGGHRALSASDDETLRLWDVVLGREIRSFVGHDAEVNSVAVTADGKLAVSGGHDETMRLWEVATGRLVRTFPTRGGPVLKVAISPDGRYALSSSRLGVVQLWDVASGNELRTLTTAARRVFAVAFSPDGTLAFTGRPVEMPGVVSNTRAGLWRLDSGKELQTFGGFSFEVESATFSPDGRRLFTAGYDRIVSVWDADSGQRVRALKGHQHGLTGALFSASDRLIISGGHDNAVKLWDADSGELVRSFDAGDSVEAMAVSPDGKLILTGGFDSTLRLWDLTVGEEVRRFPGHESPVTGVDISPDDRLAVSVGIDRKIKLWDVATGREIRTLDQGATAHAAAISPDGRVLITAGASGRMKVWDLFDGRELRQLVGHQGMIRGVAFSADGKQLISGSDFGEVKVWEVATGLELRSWKHFDEVRGVTFSPDGKLAVTGSFDGTAKFFDVATGRIVRVLRPAAGERIGTVAISPDGKVAATGNDAKLVRLWEVATGRELRVLSGHVGDVRAVRFSQDGRLLFSGSRDRTVRVWDVASGRSLHAFSWSTDALRSMTVSRDGRFVLSGSEDGSMRLWEFGSVAQRRALEARLGPALATLRAAPQDPAALATLGEWYAFRGVSSWAVDLLRRAEQKGAAVSPLMLARCLWQEGDLPAARRDFERAREAREAPAEYLDVIAMNIGRSDQAGRLSELSRTDGRVRFPYLGIRTRSLGDGERPASPVLLAQGALITRVLPNTPASAAGLHAGDVVLRADELSIGSDAELGGYLASRSAGTSLTITYVRDGITRQTRATLAERPSRIWEPGPEQVRELQSGYALQTLTPELALTLGLDPLTQGAVVTDTAKIPNETARRFFFEDVITRVDGKPLRTAEEAATAMAGIPLDRLDRLDVLRPGRVR